LWQEPADQASEQTLQLHLDNLEVRLKSIDPEPLSPQEKGIYSELKAAFESRRASSVSEGSIPQPARLSWDDAFRLESEIGCLLSGDRLRQEIEARLRWTVIDKVPQAALLQSAYANLVKLFAQEPCGLKTPDQSFRDFFLEVMEANHWHSKRKYLTRKLRAQATRRTLVLGLGALLVALWPYVVLPSILQNSAKPANVALLSGGLVSPAILFGTNEFWGHFALYTSLTFGFLGALFSRLMTLQTQWSAMAFDDLFNARTYHYIALRACIGVLGALVVYFFLQSGLVDGKLFPKFGELTMFMQDQPVAKWPTKLVLPTGDLALLVMWAFIAGFSESLVPTVLTNTERQFAGATNAGP
jgi:hypothetical protein